MLSQPVVVLIFSWRVSSQPAQFLLHTHTNRWTSPLCRRRSEWRFPPPSSYMKSLGLLAWCFTKQWTPQFQQDEQVHLRKQILQCGEVAWKKQSLLGVASAGGYHPCRFAPSQLQWTTTTLPLNAFLFLLGCFVVSCPSSNPRPHQLVSSACTLHHKLTWNNRYT